ncbi:hypothetical protein Lesp02_24230 [Lentzea sp. NBRC 105346]|uniref:hypothetical protein n=1 Tax=Lentzea sp. NBRC 105346 TaxID=3032205 RepID=UPI0024A127A4|nr:hypothetical protein [Lentzea sp. NBRC 105346]GLZ30233.1 hypothetical protein Lesp02_24230 [Lentzea sp. NBRC 105346]
MRVRTIAASTLALLFAITPIGAQADTPPAGEITCVGDTASVNFKPGVGILQTKQALSGKADSTKCLPENPEVTFDRASVTVNGSADAKCLLLLGSIKASNEKLSGSVTWYATDGSTATSSFTASTVDITDKGMVVQGQITGGYQTGMKLDYSTVWNQPFFLDAVLRCATFKITTLKGDLTTLHVFP